MLTVAIPVIVSDRAHLRNFRIFIGRSITNEIIKLMAKLNEPKEFLAFKISPIPDMELLVGKTA